MVEITKFPTVSRNVAGLEGPGYEPYKVPAYCCIPGCHKVSDHAHHMFSRGLMGGAFNWVKLADGTITGNTIPVCFFHHDHITDNRAAVVYEDGIFKHNDQYDVTLPLTWQPPRITEDGVTSELTHEGHVETRPVCGECGRTIPKPKIEGPQEEKKIRGTWAVAVPKDERENGAETLDALLGAARDELDKAGLSYGENPKVRFYILAAVLGIFVQQAPQILSDGCPMSERESLLSFRPRAPRGAPCNTDRRRP